MESAVVLVAILLMGIYMLILLMGVATIQIRNELRKMNKKNE